VVKPISDHPVRFAARVRDKQSAGPGVCTVVSTTAPAMSAVQKPELDEHTKKILAVRALIRDRDEARSSGDFGKSDTLRDRLKNEFEVIIFDQNGGPSGWKFKDGSSKKLPSGLVEQDLPGAVKRKRDDTDGAAKKQKITDQPKPKGTKRPVAVILHCSEFVYA
jgi:hypothetical protein